MPAGSSSSVATPLRRMRWSGSPSSTKPGPRYAALPFRQRAVLTLRYYADMTEAEIADVLGCRIGTVKSAHHRAIVRLREELR